MERLAQNVKPTCRCATPQARARALREFVKVFALLGERAFPARGDEGGARAMPGSLDDRRAAQQSAKSACSDSPAGNLPGLI